MKRTCILLFFICLYLFGFAQKDFSKQTPFWKHDFNDGKIPSGWISKAENDSNVAWICTDQPFPGSHGLSRQAPPIASKSRGSHLQFSPGVRTGKLFNKWGKNKIYPNAYVQTSAIDCSNKKSVVLKFQENFRWNDKGGIASDAGLFVEVSNDGKTWKQYDVRNGIMADNDCPNPINIELNITAYAAQQKTVYLRFHWKGLFSWYWMIDDIELSEALETDIQALDMTSYTVENNTFGKEDNISFRIVNLSARPINSPFKCYLQIDQRPLMEVLVPATTRKPFKVVDTMKVTFPKVDMTDFGIHQIKFYSGMLDDRRNSNDTISAEIYSKAFVLGEVTGFKQSGSSFTFTCHNAKVKTQFYKPNLFRVQMAYNGIFTNPPGNDIVIADLKDTAKVKLSESNEYFLMQTSEISLRAYKKPLRFALYKSDNKTLIFEELQGITYGHETRQYFKRGKEEYFYGGGMQNGRYSHRGKTIKLTIDYNWEDGGNPNPAPFYMSTAGYGALRNTYTPGEYSFKDTLKLVHVESRFDCYYFTGNSLKDILKGYTDITGHPFLPPRWGLNMGDANCYNRGAGGANNTTGYKGTTPGVISLVADKYVQNNMPRGWILPNDGYGCGYTKLDSVITELKKRGFHTGLWTENGVEKIAREVGEYGSRLCKLDVAWVGDGYKFALDGCKTAYEGIEKSSNARGFVWSVCGWAGTHRNSVVWTGDQYSSWNYIRWHIPTIVGSGLSAQNCASGDLDAIFGGTAKTYTRDLEWKCFTPVFMSMSGWADKDKQPYMFGEPYTSINRKYLELKMRLTPYMYTLCNEAWETGTPAVRAMNLEYPEDKLCYTDLVKYQYLLGESFLVAPVYRDTTVRDSIYLPKGKWFDYWSGEKIKGEQTLMGYSAPLDKLPLFVKEGSVIPMNKQMYYDAQYPADTLTLDIYPGKNANFEMFEDEGSNRDYREGLFSKTKFSTTTDANGEVTKVDIGVAFGDYKGKLNSRAYILQIHTEQQPNEITIIPTKLAVNQSKQEQKTPIGFVLDKKIKLKMCKDKNSFEKAKSGWYFDKNDKGGLLKVKTQLFSTNNPLSVNIK